MRREIEFLQFWYKRAKEQIFRNRCHFTCDTAQIDIFNSHKLIRHKKKLRFQGNALNIYYATIIE